MTALKADTTDASFMTGGCRLFEHVAQFDLASDSRNYAIVGRILDTPLLAQTESDRQEETMGRYPGKKQAH